MSVIRVRNTTLGLTLDTGSIGWALVKKKRPEMTDFERGDLDMLIERRLEGLDPLRGEIQILSYLNDDVYAGSKGHSDGMSRTEHCLLVAQKAAQLSADGWQVIILELEW